MYSVFDYGRMLGDRERVAAYRAALAAVVRPGSVVVDLGAGIGFFALEACRLGASKVYAIETNDAVTVLPELAKRNGFADRIEVMHRSSTEVTLERKADVIVADLRGVTPLYGANAAVLADARARHLAPGGTIIPSRDVLLAALVESPALAAEVLGGFVGHDVDLSPARTLAANIYHRDRSHPVTAEQLLTPGIPWTEIRYGEPPPKSYAGTISARALRAGDAHGIVVWFDATLVEAIGFSTAPGSERVYGRAFLPFEEPLHLDAGDDVTLDLRATRGAGDHVWAWEARTARESRRHSTFLGDPSPASSFLKEAGDYAPRLGPAGQARAAILAAMDGRAALADIAARIHAAHPGVFASLAECLEETRKRSRRFG